MKDSWTNSALSILRIASASGTMVAPVATGELVEMYFVYAKTVSPDSFILRLVSTTNVIKKLYIRLTTNVI